MRLRGLGVPTGRLHLYVRLDPTVAGNGGGGQDNAGADSATADRNALVASDTNTQTALGTSTVSLPLAGKVVVYSSRHGRRAR